MGVRHGENVMWQLPEQCYLLQNKIKDCERFYTLKITHSHSQSCFWACDIMPMNLVTCFLFPLFHLYDSYSVILLLLLLIWACNSRPETVWFWARHGPMAPHQVPLPLGVYISVSISFIPFIWFLFCYCYFGPIIPGPKTLWFCACDSAPGSIAFGCIHFHFLHSIYMILILLFCYFCYYLGPVILGPETLWFQARDSAPGSIAFGCVIFHFLYSIYIFIWFIFCWSVTSAVTGLEFHTRLRCLWVGMLKGVYFAHVSLFNWKNIIYIYIYIL